VLLIELLEKHYILHREVSAGYEASIRSAIRTFEKFMAEESEQPIRPAALEDLSDERLHACAAWMIRKKLARASANRVLRTLAAQATYAFRHKLSTYRPDLEKVAERLPRPVSWRPEEMAKIVLGIHKLYGNEPWGKRLLAYTIVYFQTALRMRDIFSLESTPADWEKGVVFTTEHKTGKRRSYVLDSDALRALANIGATWQKPVPYPYKETQPARKRLRRVLKAEGMPNTRRDLFQKFRRTTATIAHNEGIDATQLLGHSARWVTEKYYLDADMATPMNVAAVLPKLRVRNTDR
jgi:integrase